MSSPQREERRFGAGREAPVARGGLASVLRSALGQFAQLTGQEPERVSGVRPADDGWSVLIDVVELERIPSTTSVLATYRADVDADGNLCGYERLRRFVRGATDPL
ncbi:gas vesicle protein [Frankia sp. CNm7]|uniref:Gas vesicle protein n=1 Tax=Frankia nepalensis TaxID=1836974 RepID=A0A937R791_9ACTN|nr:gas vesicle protein [Frankia nepalensis]MBL7496593.1 gas vesicle protein [Frankia nepalensis]MBL7513336.1 gas vesicle protein [Frankia nepalensis]MBL7518118.1 gas vesicle protein [Frankia nepalensis]MBL7626601.1 gas vesicle protein [Frankia nepalensis]